MRVSLTKQQGLAAHTQPACTTLQTTITTSTHNPPIMASSPSASDWECGACASFNKGGKYCSMCATPCPKRQALLAALTADAAVHTAVVAAPAAVAKVIPSVPRPGSVVGTPVAVAALPAVVAKTAETVIGTSSPVAKKLKAPVASLAKASKECALVAADVAAPAEVVAMPTPVRKVPGLFHLTGVVVEIIETEMVDQGRSCEEHVSNCGKVMVEDVVVCLRKEQIQVEGQEETAIIAYWVTDVVNCCHVGFLPCHMVRHTTRYNGALVQVTRVFNVDPTCCNTTEHHAFHKNNWCCLAVITTW
jgi:hypothetical protein